MTKRLLPLSLLTLVFLLPGCAGSKHHAPGQPQPKAAPALSKNVITPDESLAAKVLSVNLVGRFVVLNFPTGRMPRLEQHLFLYRNGLKTAEVKIVGPIQDTNIVADILSGEAQAGDTVSDQ